MNVLILGGFLGSGKTTLLLKLIERLCQMSDKDVPVAILENEIGSVGIDDGLIASRGYQVSTMLSGCACCTLAGELPEAVMGIERDLNPDLLIIEATGVAVPSVMAENLQKVMGIDPWVCVIVDASRWRRMQLPLDVLLRQQLRTCDIICMNKIDLIDEVELAYVRASLDDYNEGALRIDLCASGDLPADIVSAIMGGGRWTGVRDDHIRERVED